MTSGPDRRTALAAALDDRRLQLGLSWREVAARAGVSPEAIRAARRGTAGMRDLTAAGIERALQLDSGAIQRFLAGTADSLPEAAPKPPMFVTDNYTDPIVREIWNSPRLSEAARLALIRIYLAELSRATPGQPDREF